MTQQFQVIGSSNARRNMRGDLQAMQRILLSERLYIEVLTCKRYGGNLVTTARVWQYEGYDVGFATTVMFQDWSQQLISNRVRCTIKAIEQQQAEGLAMAQDLALGVYNQYVSAGKINIPVEQSLASQVANGGGDAWVAAAKSGQIMRIM
jgi:hypothetical protein